MRLSTANVFVCVCVNVELHLRCWSYYKQILCIYKYHERTCSSVTTDILTHVLMCLLYTMLDDRVSFTIRIFVLNLLYSFLSIV